jgi:hypothetical protein
MNPDLQHLLGELALVNQQVPMVTLDILNGKLSPDAQAAFGDRLVRLGEGFRQCAGTEHVTVVDSEARA